MVTQTNRLTVTVDEVAEILGIGRGLAYQLVREGRIPALRLGSKWVIPRAQLDRMLSEKEGASDP